MHLIKMLYRKRTQVGTEYLIMFAVLLCVLIPLWFYVSSASSSSMRELKEAYARHAVKEIKNAADIVFIQGYPSKSIVQVSFPEGIIRSNVSGNLIELTLYESGGETDVFEITRGEVRGTLPTSPGMHLISVKMEEGGYVNVSEGG